MPAAHIVGNKESTLREMYSCNTPFVLRPSKINWNLSGLMGREVYGGTAKAPGLVSNKPAPMPALQLPGYVILGLQCRHTPAAPVSCSAQWGKDGNCSIYETMWVKSFFLKHSLGSLSIVLILWRGGVSLFLLQ